MQCNNQNCHLYHSQDEMRTPYFRLLMMHFSSTYQETEEVVSERSIHIKPFIKIYLTNISSFYRTPRISSISLSFLTWSVPSNLTKFLRKLTNNQKPQILNQVQKEETAVSCKWITHKSTWWIQTWFCSRIRWWCSSRWSQKKSPKERPIHLTSWEA